MNNQLKHNNMKSRNLITAQIISFVILLLSMNEITVNSASTFIFVVSFTIFIYCSLYINKHKKELLREIRNEYQECNE